MPTILQWLTSRFPNASRQTLKRMVANGTVFVDGRPAARLTQIYEDAARVTLRQPHKSDTARSPARRPYRIIFEDGDILVVEKPPGLLTSTVPREKRPTLLAMLRRDLAAGQPGARLGLIHRLDRDAGGLLIFSKNNAAYQSLKRQFFIHSVGRVYTAIVHGHPNPPAGRIASRLVERADGTVHSTVNGARGQLALTHYETLRRIGQATELKITLETGRKHQIRVQMAERGHAIVGDATYDKPDAKGLRLWATQLSVDHPRTGKRMTFSIAPGFCD